VNQLVEVFVPALADPEQLRFAAGGELQMGQAKPGCETTTSLEALRSPECIARGSAQTLPFSPLRPRPQDQMGVHWLHRNIADAACALTSLRFSVRTPGLVDLRSVS
jgi:hypothetical protein